MLNIALLRHHGLVVTCQSEVCAKTFFCQKYLVTTYVKLQRWIYSLQTAGRTGFKLKLGNRWAKCQAPLVDQMNRTLLWGSLYHNMERLLPLRQSYSWRRKLRRWGWLLCGLATGCFSQLSREIRLMAIPGPRFLRLSMIQLRC